MPNFGDARLPNRFWDKVIPDPMGGCWLWIGADVNGYGQIKFGPKLQGSHRLAYRVLIGEIPKGLHLDHLCRVRACCNPAHLEPVTPRENTLRGIGVTAMNANKTECPRGHQLPAEPIKRWRHGAWEIWRRCVRCHRDEAALRGRLNRQRAKQVSP